jgi:hypothetical protein
MTVSLLSVLAHWPMLTPSDTLALVCWYSKGVCLGKPLYKAGTIDYGTR